MKKTITLILTALMVLCSTDAMAQKKPSKRSKKNASPYIEGRQKVRESDYQTFDKYTTFSTKDAKLYYTPYNYMDFNAATKASNPDWAELQPVMNYLQKVSRATLTMCALYAINPDITDRSERDALSEKARKEAMAALDKFNGWKTKKEMRNKIQYQVAEIDYEYFKGANYYNSMRGDEIIHVGLMLYFGSKKKALFAADTTSRKFQDIKFFPNDATIQESWKPMIEEIAEFLVENERKGLLLTGYADNQGTAEYCIGISRQRAMEVKKALVLLGIDGKRIEIEAKGDENPIGDNSTYEGRIQNNRVTIQIQ